MISETFLQLLILSVYLIQKQVGTSKHPNYLKNKTHQKDVACSSPVKPFFPELPTYNKIFLAFDWSVALSDGNN